MAIKNAQPMRFTPRGLVDAFDSSDKFPGACQVLANLIFDQSNPELMIPRPGVITIQNLAGQFTNPGFISVQACVGTRVYGMVATSRFLGHDEPFCYDTQTNSFVPISGVTLASTPTSPSTSGEWEPPTMASIGVFIIITHPGFSGGNHFGAIDLTVPTAPAWTAGTTAVTALTARPTAVANLNNRAYFVVGNTLQYTDVLLPKTRTAASQSLTVGDSAPVTTLAGLPMQTTSSGVLAALTAFKATQVWQVTGDTTTSNLSLNYLSLTVGTSSPRTVVQSPQGLYFVASGGPYLVDPLGAIRAVTNNMQSSEPDIQSPFINATTPTRWAAAYNSSIYRVCGPTVIRGVQATNDYWFDEHRRRWTGPHSFAYDCGSAIGGNFVLTSVNAPGFLLLGQPSPTLSTVYNDVGTSFFVNLISSSFPKAAPMAMKQVAESQIELGGLPVGATYTITAQDDQGTTLDTVTITVPADTTLPRWGSMIWGAFNWASAQNRAPRTYAVPWHVPLVFDKMQLAISALASQNIQIGTFFARYQQTGYMVMN